MYKLLRKLVPKFMKKRFKNLIHSIVNSNENILRIDPIQDNLHVLNVQMSTAEKNALRTENLLVELSGLDRRIASYDDKIKQLFEKQQQQLQLLHQTSHDLQKVNIRINEEMTTVGHQLQVLAERIDQGKSSHEIAVVRNAIDVINFHLEDGKKHIRQLHSHIFELSPEIIPVTESVKQVAEAFAKENKAPEVDLSIHKNDLMFLHSWIFRGEITNTYTDYLRVGLNQANICRKVTDTYLSKKETELKLLDFASGYGRATRYLTKFYQPENITVSDIKHQSVDFQIEQFGVKGIYSYDEPGKFSTSDLYDFIFVGSLFSHLPEDKFMEWLRTLLNCLDAKGIIAITVHDQSIGDRKEGISYHQQSEDTEYSYVSDAILDTAIYGVTYVDEKFVRNALKKLTKPYHYQRFPQLFGKLQDVYLISEMPLNKEIKGIWEYP